jgi:flagellar motor switch protein FliG
LEKGKKIKRPTVMTVEITDKGYKYLRGGEATIEKYMDEIEREQLIDEFFFLTIKYYRLRQDVEAYYRLKNDFDFPSKTAEEIAKQLHSEAETEEHRLSKRLKDIREAFVQDIYPP